MLLYLSADLEERRLRGMEMDSVHRALAAAGLLVRDAGRHMVKVRHQRDAVNVYAVPTSSFAGWWDKGRLVIEDEEEAFRGNAGTATRPETRRHNQPS